MGSRYNKNLILNNVTTDWLVYDDDEWVSYLLIAVLALYFLNISYSACVFANSLFDFFVPLKILARIKQFEYILIYLFETSKLGCYSHLWWLRISVSQIAQDHPLSEKTIL